MVEISDSLSCLFTAEIDSDDDSYTIEVPEQEIELGQLATDEAYRVALLPTENADTSSPHSQSSETGERKPPELATGDPPVEEGEMVDVTVESIGEKGDGIAKVGPGYVVIVPDTEIDEQVTARISEVKDNVAFAEVVERHAPQR